MTAIGKLNKRIGPVGGIFIQNVFLMTVLVLQILFSPLYATKSENKDEKQKAESLQALERRLQSLQGLDKIKLHYRLARRYKQQDADKMITHALTGFRISSRLGDLKQKAIGLGLAGIGYSYRSKYGPAIKHVKEAIQIFRRIGDRKNVSGFLADLGTIYQDQGANSQALSCFLESLKTEKQLKNEIGVARCLTNIGIIYWETKEYQKAMKSYQDALLIAKKYNNRNGITSLMINIGIIHFETGQYEKALEFYGKAMDIASQAKDHYSIAILSYNIGESHLKNRELEKALASFRRGQAILTEMKYSYGISNTAIKIGHILSLKGDPEGARKQLEKAIRIAREIKADSLIRDGYLELSNFYAESGVFQKAHRFLKEHLQIKEKIALNETRKRLKMMEIDRVNEQNIRKIERLEKENEIKILKLKSQQLQRHMMLLILLVVAVVLFVMLRRYRNLFAFWKKKNYVGSYRLIERIGSGGMANIYKASSGTGMNKRLIALKLIKEEYLFDAVYRKRFIDEGKIVDALDHPHIVKVYERTENQKNLFIAMELLEGITLEDRISRPDPISLQECLEIMIQILDALTTIHDRGIIHRDIKPANIMLIRKNNLNHYVKILDFGLAKTQNLSRVTESGMVVGTLHYLAPEQILDSKYSAASDIYALGVIMYEMLTRKRPYHGETALEIMQTVFRDSIIAPNNIMDTIPAMINDTILEMINRDPDIRPNAKKLADCFRKELGQI